MRLPTANVKQAQLEDSRQFHERLYAAFTDPSSERIYLASEDAGGDLIRLSGSLHRFWLARGFKLRCKQDKAGNGFYVWLEVRKPKTETVETAA